ncbi:alpha-hydroxy acid oxidase [Deinococcus saxicola]|uniref:alpha-hydroxy acid oxidase n=1 Tax=Deinococcus saxicola TaxID=249406 RepID=UPI0039F0CBB4
MTTTLPTQEQHQALARAVNLSEIEALGRERLDQNALDYYASGANDGHTVRANREDFARIRLRPRMLVDVSSIDTSTQVLGLPLDFPVGVAPSAFHGLAHPDAELATARAAAGMGSVMTLSTFSNTPIAEVGQAAAGRFWFQLYLLGDRELSREIIARAGACGARALVFTVDAPYLGRREANERHRFALPPHLSAPNVASREALAGVETDTGSQLTNYFQNLVDKSFTWNDLGWLRAQTDLPIVLKGILTAEDAELAVQHGCHIWVSNHGGRQLDTAVSAISALPEIADVVAGRAEIYLDGGISRGTDVIKAVALGARAVFLGRPALWGLAAGGEDGVRRVLELLKDEVRLALALSGKQNLKEVGRDLLKM